MLQLLKPVIGESYTRDVLVDIRQSSDGKRTTVIINTDDVDGHGTIIEPQGCRLDRYAKNPIVLINHDYRIVAGNSTVALRGGQLVAEMDDEAWDHEDPEIEKWFRKVKKGIVRAASVGFLIHSFSEEMVDDVTIWRITDWELLEWSFVTVPSNANALVSERKIEEMLVKMQFDIERLTQVAQQRQADPTQEPPTPAAPEPARPVPEQAAINNKPITRAATDAEVQNIIDGLTPRIGTLVRRKLGKE